MGIYIIGAGGAGKEVWGWLSHMNYVVDGFLDETFGPIRGIPPYEVIASPFDFDWKPSDFAVVAIGESKKRLETARKLQEMGVNFWGLVHPSVIFSSRAKMGIGGIMFPYSVVASTAKIGDFLFANFSSYITHDTIIGNGCTFGPHASALGHSVLGDGVYLGAHASVLPGIKVGDFAIVGAGAIVTKNVEPGLTVKGIPAR